MQNFQIGDYVEVRSGSDYSITSGGQKGTIRRIDGNLVYLNWDLENKYYFNSRSATLESASQWYIRITDLKLVTPVFSEGLTPVQRKCKKLWNNSNWVKKHPQQAY